MKRDKTDAKGPLTPPALSQLATFVMSLVALGGAGLVTPTTMRLFLMRLPALIVGTLVGWALYGKPDESTFRKVVLVLLLISGLAIVGTIHGPHP